MEAAVFVIAAANVIKAMRELVLEHGCWWKCPLPFLRALPA